MLPLTLSSWAGAGVLIPDSTVGYVHKESVIGEVKIAGDGEIDTAIKNHIGRHRHRGATNHTVAARRLIKDWCCVGGNHEIAGDSHIGGINR